MDQHPTDRRPMTPTAAAICREYGPFPGVAHVHGVSWDGAHVWIATGDTVSALDPGSGAIVRVLAVAGTAGTAFDGRHLFQIAGDRIHKVDPASGRVIASVAVPAGGASGLAWSEGTLWVGQYGARRIHQVDPDSGAILRTIESNRFVTGVTWVDGELWHGSWQSSGDTGHGELCRIDPGSGAVIEALAMPAGVAVSGLESDGGDMFFCGGAASGKVRAVRRRRAGAAS